MYSLEYAVLVGMQINCKYWNPKGNSMDTLLNLFQANLNVNKDNLTAKTLLSLTSRSFEQQRIHLPPESQSQSQLMMMMTQQFYLVIQTINHQYYFIWTY